MSDDYDWAEDAITSYNLAIQTLRERYLENRLPGESAKEWLERTSNGKFLPPTCAQMKKGLRGDN